MKTTADEIYLESKDIANVEETIKTLLNDLRSATEKHMGKIQYNQVVMQLNHDESDGHDWKMFVYYDYESKGFYCSFQNENYYDTDFDYNYTLEGMAEHMQEEVNEVGGFEWIARDED